MTKKLVLPTEVQEWLDRQPKTEHRKNVYTCDTCHREAVTIDTDRGVTPFMISCRATPGCQGTMQSNFYHCDPARVAQFEWYRPETLDGLPRQTQEHVMKGGLLIRQLPGWLQETPRVEYSIAHRKGMNLVGEGLWPDGRVPWEDAVPPDLERNDSKHTTGRLRSCGYCGSMHPSDVAAAIAAGAKGDWATMKYGWPHKSYFDDIPNPHAGLLEARAFSSQEEEGYIQMEDGMWREPGTPAPATTYGKFYTVHLMDATPGDRAVIERHLGLHFEFMPDGRVSWKRIEDDKQAAKK